MTRARAGMALPAALIALIVLAGLAALATSAAIAATRESAAVAADARAFASRDAIRARMHVHLARYARAALVAGPVALGGGDTTLTVTALPWPWHRIGVRAAGRDVIVELARSDAPTPPWCGAAVSAGVFVVATGTVWPDPSSSCAQAQMAATRAEFAAFDSVIIGALMLGARRDTLALSSAQAPGTWRADLVADLWPGTVLDGVVIAPVIHLHAGARVRGLLVARDSLVIDAGATLIEDALAVRAALVAQAAIRLAGRRGMLAPP